MMSACSEVAGGTTAVAGAAAATYFLTLPAVPSGFDLDDQRVAMTGEEHKVGGSI